MMQMGLHVISIDGMLIRQARSYILKCHGCGKYASQNKIQLSKISLSIDFFMSFLRKNFLKFIYTISYFVIDFLFSI